MFNLNAKSKLSKILLIFGLVVIFSYLTSMCLNYKSYTIENMTDTKRTTKDKEYYNQLYNELKNVNESSKDLLLIDKYKSEYFNLLDELHKNTQLNMLKLISEYSRNIVNGKILESNKHQQNKMEQIEKLNILSNSINDSLKFLYAN